MTVTYTLVRNDLLHYYRHLLGQTFKMPPGWAFNAGAVLFTIGLFVAGAISSEKIETLPTYEVISVALSLWGATVAWSCSTPRLRAMVEREAQTNPSLFAESCVTISPDWLTAASAFSDVRLRWQAIHQITFEAQYIYISVIGRALIVPKSVFRDPAEAQTFLSAATQYWRVARQMPIGAENNASPPAPCVGA